MSNPADEATTAASLEPLSRKQLIAGILFGIAALYLATVVPTVEIAWVTGILLFTIYLFAFEVVEVDVAAATVMVLLGLTSLLAPLMGLDRGLVDTQHLFDGFASNAVISIIAVMIIGAGLDKTGLMSKVASFILKIGGTTETRIIPIISATVGVISSFMQNVGATALFLPVVSRISARSGLPMSRLLMPMGFCAILGGTVTMVGSSPLILLNDLILTSNEGLKMQGVAEMQTWNLFSVTPIGLALVVTGIIYFVLAGRLVLPTTKGEGGKATDSIAYLQKTYGVEYCMKEMVIPKDSELVGKTLNDVEGVNKIRVVAMVRGGNDLAIGPGGIARDVPFEASSAIGIVAAKESCSAFAAKYGLRTREDFDAFSDALAPTKAGIAEVVIPPGSALIGKSARDVWMRKRYGLSMVALHSGGKTRHEGEGIRDLPLQAGDTIVGHIPWEALIRLEKDRDFVVVTTEYPHEELRPNKVPAAGVFFTIALGLVLFTDLRLSVALLTGAMGMILSRVLTIEEAYQAVSWKTVFLLASLIPLGLAVETTGTAKWIAEQVLSVVGAAPGWVIQASVAVLATFFTLVMSNVGATVLLVPLAVNIAIGVGADPAVFALTVAIATSNSFLIPTHQVNALIMGPGGYGVPDFMRAGSVMTLLFLVVMMLMMNLVF
ncbi:SLC13 family permease [Candidatus Thiosymbion oneisti]|uniref:SLC13 family permease n=1 Tax=Candidatus Thiosymbion oneisti TaxID=589554 RepID=UPI00106107BF|nr:SLC13 family permease [Candidatus Thiosymbion oneisti]